MEETKTVNNTLAIRPSADDQTELFEYTLIQGSKYFTLANRKWFNAKIKRIGFIDTKSNHGNLFNIYGHGIYESSDLILALEESVDFDGDKQYKILLVDGKDILYFSLNLNESGADYYTNYKDAKEDFEYLLDRFKGSVSYNHKHKLYFNK
tara:strand:+ start:43 stop:495 length:453 start_codon:yes stop_codon:yes gene_type:complete